MLKSFIQKFLLIAFLATACVNPAFASQDYQIESQPQVLEKIVQLEQKGILKQKDNGYLYVDVSNDYVAQALTSIETQGRIVPPSHYKSKKGIGAHISVMYENEQIENEIWGIKELGQEFTFQILEIRTVKLNKDGRLKKLWLIAVSSPELEKLRESYGLGSKLKNHDFHITIGTQVPGQAATKPGPCFPEFPIPPVLPEEELEEAA